MRQLLDEAHGVRDQHAWTGFRLQRAHGGVERREQLVLDQHLAAGQRTHQRGFSGVGVADQRHPQLVAPGGAALVAIALHRIQLLLQFRQPVAYLAAVQVERGFAGTWPLLPSAAGRGLAHPGCHVFQPRHLHLKLGFPGVCVAVEYLDDDAGAVQHLGAGRAFQVAYLAWRQLVIDDHVFRFPGAVRGRPGGAGSLAGIVETLPRLGFWRRRHRPDHPGAASQRGQFGELAAAEQQPRTGALASLRDRGSHLVAQGFYQPPELLQAGVVRGVVDILCLYADKDSQRDRGFGLHDRQTSTN